MVYADGRGPDDHGAEVVRVLRSLDLLRCRCPNPRPEPVRPFPGAVECARCHRGIIAGG